MTSSISKSLDKFASVFAAIDKCNPSPSVFHVKISHNRGLGGGKRFFGSSGLQRITTGTTRAPYMAMLVHNATRGQDFMNTDGKVLKFKMKKSETLVVNSQKLTQQKYAGGKHIQETVDGNLLFLHGVLHLANTTTSNKLRPHSNFYYHSFLLSYHFNQCPVLSRFSPSRHITLPVSRHTPTQSSAKIWLKTT